MDEFSRILDREGLAEDLAVAEVEERGRIALLDSLAAKLRLVAVAGSDHPAALPARAALMLAAASVERQRELERTRADLAKAEEEAARFSFQASLVGSDQPVLADRLQARAERFVEDADVLRVGIQVLEGDLADLEEERVAALTAALRILAVEE